jgi:hypothetical protein
MAGVATIRKREKKRSARKMGVSVHELRWKGGILWTPADSITSPVEATKVVEPKRR